MISEILPCLKGASKVSVILDSEYIRPKREEIDAGFLIVVLWHSAARVFCCQVGEDIRQCKMGIPIITFNVVRHTELEPGSFRDSEYQCVLKHLVAELTMCAEPLKSNHAISL